MASVTTTSSTTAAPDWVEKYPPLFALVIALVIALAILPSALNLPQTNPTQTLEYAPVPPDDDTPPSEEGNISSLGLGTSSNLETGGAAGGEGAGEFIDPITDDGSKGGNPSNKRCVGNPPRQTEDPASPPCVGFFKGSNGGATYQGVTAEEVRLLVYSDQIDYINASDPNNRVPEANKYYDLGKPADPASPEHLEVKGMRGWQRYFNDRFQTYGRSVRFFVFFAGDTTVEQRRAHAAGNYETVKPFAVLSAASLGNEDAYLQAMAKRGVLNFGSFGGRTSDFFQRYPKLVWGYQPSIEQQAEQYSTYVCTKVANKPVVRSGNPNENGKPRKFGMMYTSDPDYPGLHKLQKLVEQKISACGVTISGRAVYPICCLAQNARQNPSYAATQMAEFQRTGITTILWTGGIEGNYGKAATGSQYHPEWILVGDGQLDAPYPVTGAGLREAFDGRAFVVTPETMYPAARQQLCYQAYREADPELPEADLAYVCDHYRNLFQFFVGVQVAGPKLGPTSVDKGFHAIPPIESKNPQVPSCFYYVNDYTCVKDAQVMFFTQSEQPPGATRPGCYKAIENGKRYLPGKWPPGNIDAQITGTSEPCNGFDAGFLFRR